MSENERGLVEAAAGAPFYTEERCYITELLNTPRCAEVSLAHCRVEAGETTQLHSLEVAERYVVQSGSGLMQLDDEPGFEIRPGDCVLIPPGCAQRVKNTGSDDLEFLCVCTPRFEPRHYENLERPDTPAL